MWSRSLIWSIRSSARTGLCQIVCCLLLHASTCYCRGNLTLVRHTHQTRKCVWNSLDCKQLINLSFILCVRLTSVINPPVDVIASCVNCLSVLAARMPGKVGMLGTCRVNRTWNQSFRVTAWTSFKHSSYISFFFSGVVQSAPHRLPPLCL